MLLFERTFHKDLKTEESCETIKRYHVLKFEFFAIFSNKMAGNSNFITLYPLIG